MIVAEEKVVRNDSEYCMIAPAFIDPDDDLTDTFGKRETEMSAETIVRFCQERRHWGPFTYDDINEFWRSQGKDSDFEFCGLVDLWSSDPFSSPVRGGFIIKNDGEYYITHTFILRVYRRHGKFM